METLAPVLQTASALTASAQRAVERRRSAQHGGVRSNGWLGCVPLAGLIETSRTRSKANALLAHGFGRRAGSAWRLRPLCCAIQAHALLLEHALVGNLNRPSTGRTGDGPWRKLLLMCRLPSFFSSALSGRLYRVPSSAEAKRVARTDCQMTCHSTDGSGHTGRASSDRLRPHHISPTCR